MPCRIGSTHGPYPRREKVGAVGVATTLVALSWVLAGVAGAAGIARTDDWAFSRVAFALHRTGSIHLVGWGPMTLVGLAAWAQPWLWLLGDRTWVLDLSVAALAVVGFVAAHRLARTLLAPGVAAVAVAGLVAFPGVVRDATTFMTDGPALALQAVVLALGAASLRATGSRAHTLRLAALAVGWWAFSVRELAIAAPVAVLLAWWARGERRVRVEALALAAASLALWSWRQSLPGNQPYAGRPPLAIVVTLVASGLLTASLGLAPIVAWTAPRWWHPRRRGARIAGMAVGALLAGLGPLVAALRHQRLWWFVGDYLQANGMNGDKLALGHRPMVLPAGVWDLLVVLAIASLVVTAGLVGEWLALRRSRPAARRLGRDR